MEVFQWLRDKLSTREDDDDGIGYETKIMVPRPHVELFNDTREYHCASQGDYTSTEKLWPVDKEDREAMFLSYSFQGNFLILVTQETMDKMALIYQYQHRQADITYKLYFHSAKSFLNNHHSQFERPEGIVLDSTHIIHVTVLQKETLILVLGFNSNGKLSLYCYSVINNSRFAITTVADDNFPRGDAGFSVECTKPYVLRGNQFSKLTTVVTGETQEEGHIAIAFSDLSDRPRPLLLYIWKCVPKLSLLHSINLSDIYKSMRGVVSGLSFWNDRKDMIIVSTCAQLFHLSLVKGEHSRNYKNLKKKHLFLEKEEERINLIKIYPRYLKDEKELLYGIGQNGKLFMIPDLADLRSTPVKMIDLEAKLPVEEFKIYNHEICHFSKKVYMLAGNGYIYIYDLTRQRFVTAVKIPEDKHEVDENWRMHLRLNWFGTEAYFISKDNLYVVNSPIINSNLKQLARIAVLKSYSEEDILKLDLAKSILAFLFNK